MSTTQAIDKAVYTLLKNDSTLDGLATIYKGTKRPSGAENPSVTVGSVGITPGNGEGINICGVVMTVYMDILSNRMADNTVHETIMSRISGLLADTVIVLENAKCLPLKESGNTGIEWKNVHDTETFQKIEFDLTFIDFT